MTEISSIEFAGRRLIAERLAAGEEKRDELAAEVEVAARARDDLEPPPHPPPAASAHDMFWGSINATLMGAAPSLACLMLAETPAGTLDTSTTAAGTIVVFGALSGLVQRQLAEQSDHSLLSCGGAMLVAPHGVRRRGTSVCTGCRVIDSVVSLRCVARTGERECCPDHGARRPRARTHPSRPETFPQRQRAAEQRLERARAALLYWDQTGQREHQEHTVQLAALFEPDPSKPHITTVANKTRRPISINESA